MSIRDPEEVEKRNYAIASFIMWHLMLFLLGYLIASVITGDQPIIGGALTMLAYFAVDRLWTYKETGKFMSLELYRRNFDDI